jgi:hypothetical protein
MTPMQIALINLIAKVGLDAAIIITEQLAKATTPQEAVAALKAARDKTAEQYLVEAKSSLPATGS